MSLKIQLSVLAVPCIVVVCPPPRAYLSISELSRPSPRALWVKSGHPVMGQRTDSWCVFLSSHPGPEPKPHSPLSDHLTERKQSFHHPRDSSLLCSCQKAWGSSKCSYGKVSRISYHMHKGKSRTAGIGGPISCSKGEGL